MEGNGKLKTPEIKNKKTYRVEHFPSREHPEIDVVVNLDYPNQEETEMVLGVLRKSSQVAELLDEIKIITNDEGEKLFFVKKKREPVKKIDPADNKEKIYPKGISIPSHADSRVRLAFVGMSNEIIIAEKIRNIMSSNEVQELAKRYGLERIRFAEPVMAVVDRKEKDHKKYLIYKNIQQQNNANNGYAVIYNNLLLIAEGLTKIFLANGICPYDLSSRQLLITKENEKPVVVLIDTEVYTEINKSATGQAISKIKEMQQQIAGIAAIRLEGIATALFKGDFVPPDAVAMATEIYESYMSSIE